MSTDLDIPIEGGSKSFRREQRTTVLQDKGQTDSMVFVSEDWLR